MSRPIEAGDQVVVSMSRSDIFLFQTGPHFLAIVCSVPMVTGDAWNLELPGPGEIRVNINPMSVDFVGIVRGGGEQPVEVVAAVRRLEDRVGLLERDRAKECGA